VRNANAPLEPLQLSVEGTSPGRHGWP